MYRSREYNNKKEAEQDAAKQALEREVSHDREISDECSINSGAAYAMDKLSITSPKRCSDCEVYIDVENRTKETFQLIEHVKKYRTGVKIIIVGSKKCNSIEKLKSETIGVEGIDILLTKSTMKDAADFYITYLASTTTAQNIRIMSTDHFADPFCDVLRRDGGKNAEVIIGVDDFIEWCHSF